MDSVHKGSNPFLRVRMVLLPVLLGVVLGLSLAAPPGPMNALIARESGRHGATAGIRVGLGAPVADVVFLVALLYGLRPILDDPAWIRGAAAAGALIMFAFAYDTWFPGRDAEEDTGGRPATFWAGFAAALTNPYQVAWWLSGGFVFLEAQGGWGIVGLLVGIFGWVLAFSWLVAHGAQRWSWFSEAVRIGSASLLSLFSVLLLGVAYGLIGVA